MKIFSTILADEKFPTEDEMPIQVVSDEEAEKSDFVVCVRADEQTPFDDNEFGVCSKCGVGVQFRPHAPKKPPRLCIECVVELMAEGGKDEDG